MPVRFEAKTVKIDGPKKMAKWIADDMRKQALKPYLEKEVNKTIKGWQSDKPKFKIDVTGSYKKVMFFTLKLNGSQLSINKWNWLDLGTDPHPIVASTPRGLSFRSGYKAGSKPGRLVTYKSKSSGNYINVPAVQHPGSKARLWRFILTKKSKPKYYKQFTAFLNKAVERSGHEYKK